MAKKKQKQQYTVAEYAAINLVSPQAVYDWIKLGKVKAKQVGKIKIIEV